MKKSIFLTFLSIIMTFNMIQAQVTFTVVSLPANTPPEDNLYIAGDFNGWNPGAEAQKLQKNEEDQWFITLPAANEGSSIQFKFTRGSWDKVEKGASGEEIPNRTFTYGNGQTVEVTIYNWADGGGGSSSTAAANVSIVDENFLIPQLNRTRRVWIYLPPDYENSQKDYPVLYMHDGQNLFDNQTSFVGEWEVDETLNAMADEGFNVPIVVGVDNGGDDRIGEYTPWSNPQYGGGDGDKYAQFIVETLKPFIDANYRTLPGRENTGVMGSSLGGLISHYIALKYQETFSKAGLFSPSYWFSDNVWGFTLDQGKQQPVRFYQMCGTNEGAGVVENMMRMSDTLKKAGFTDEEIKNKSVVGGQHNEALWKSEFREAIEWLFGSGPASTGSLSPKGKLELFPNPTGEEFRIINGENLKFDSLTIMDISGKEIKSFKRNASGTYNISELVPGIYLVRVNTPGTAVEAKLVKGK